MVDNQAAALSPDTLQERERDAIAAWATAHLDGTVLSVERLRRWRPVWRVTMAEGGLEKPYLFKGARKAAEHPYSLEYEMHMLEALSDNGIPVPRLHGFCAAPPAFVMEWVAGSRDPGLVMEAIEKSSGMTAERWEASLQYMDILGAMHAIAPEPFAAKGAALPVGPDEIALNSFERFYAMFAESGVVDPFMEFTASWVRRNVPRHRTGISFVTGDCGQFLSEGSQVTCVLDMEIGYLGDPLHDLACFRGRHPVENMGDLPKLFQRYERATGQAIDLDVLAYHTVVFLGLGYSAPLPALRDLQPDIDWLECEAQAILIGRRCAEALAEIAGLELTTIVLPEARGSQREDMALARLAADIGRLPVSEDFPDWQRAVLSSLPQYLAKQAHFRRWCDDEDLAETAELLGSTPANLEDADKALTMFVGEAGPEQDRALIRLFHRRFLRQCLIMAGPDAPEDHLILAKMEPILASYKSAFAAA